MISKPDSVPMPTQLREAGEAFAKLSKERQLKTIERAGLLKAGTSKASAKRRPTARKAKRS
jgi:hypothetical protein